MNTFTFWGKVWIIGYKTKNVQDWLIGKRREGFSFSNISIIIMQELEMTFISSLYVEELFIPRSK